MNPREVLNRLKWGDKNKLPSAKVTILHRGAPDDRRVIEGTGRLELGRGFMRVLGYLLDTELVENREPGR